MRPPGSERIHPSAPGRKERTCPQRVTAVVTASGENDYPGAVHPTEPACRMRQQAVHGPLHQGARWQAGQQGRLGISDLDHRMGGSHSGHALRRSCPSHRQTHPRASGNGFGRSTPPGTPPAMRQTASHRLQPYQPTSTPPAMRQTASHRLQRVADVSHGPRCQDPAPAERRSRRIAR